MHFPINIRGLKTDDAYFDAIMVDDDLIWPLHKAAMEIDEALTFIGEGGVDNSQQREHIETQIDSMIFLLKEIRDKLEG